MAWDPIRGGYRFLIAAILWALLVWLEIFLFHLVPFWLSLFIAAFSLSLLACYARRELLFARFPLRKSLLIGTLTAASLYIVFWFFERILVRFLPFTLYQLESVYSLGTGLKPSFLGIPSLLAIAVGEELFWRGYVQEFLSRGVGPARGWWAATLLYSGVFIPSDNPLLFVSVLVAGLFWGYLYRVKRNLWLNIVSHAVWLSAVVYLFPFRQLEAGGYVSLLGTVLFG